MYNSLIIKLVVCIIICFFIGANVELCKSENRYDFDNYLINVDQKTLQQISFTIIVLPDTQHYTSSYPEIFTNQTQWIVANREKLNIVYIGHEGDIVNNAQSIIQWKRADTSISYLEDPVTTGLSDGIAYSVVRGNHDIGGLFDRYFSFKRFNRRSYYGGHYSDDNQNNYVLFNVGDFHYISVSLDYNPDFNELNWTKNILKIYSDRKAIIISHSILDNPAGDWTTSGLNIYNTVKDYPNVFLMLCGHRHYEGVRKDTYNGHTIYTLLADYQDYQNGGNGWLRILEVWPTSNIIKVKTYSPYLDQYKTDPDSEFILLYNQSENQPPPTIIGPSKGTIDVPIDYYFTTIDPQDDQVYYFINWGDDSDTGWIGPYQSGEQIIKSHTWLNKEIYTIKAKAKDPYGAESNWTTFEVSITKSKSYIDRILLFLQKFFQSFPFFEKNIITIFLTKN